MLGGISFPQWTTNPENLPSKRAIRLVTKLQDVLLRPEMPSACIGSTTRIRAPGNTGREKCDRCKSQTKTAKSLRRQPVIRILPRVVIAPDHYCYRFEMRC